MKKETISKIIWFCVMVITFLIMFVTLYMEASELDMESLRKIVPKGECYGCEMPEIKKSVWYCKEVE